MNLLWGFLLAVGVWWLGISIVMPQSWVSSRSQRLTVVAITLVYGFFVVAALVNYSHEPSRPLFKAVGIEGVLVGSIAGMITYGVAQILHWIITGYTMKSKLLLYASSGKTESQTPVAPGTSSEQQVSSVMVSSGIIYNLTMLSLLLSRTEWAATVFLLSLVAIVCVSLWGLVVKKRSPFWLFIFLAPLGWVLFFVLKNRNDEVIGS